MAEILGSPDKIGLEWLHGVVPIEGLDLCSPEAVLTVDELTEIRKDLAILDSRGVYEEEDPDNPTLVGQLT